MNELLFCVQLVICFSAVLALNRLFGKSGIYAYIAIAVVLANIEVSCTANMFGLPDGTVCLGNVTFASVYLATDILNECYGYRESKRGVLLGLITAVLFLGLVQIDTLFRPSSDGYMHDLLVSYFGIRGAFVWVTLSSIMMFSVSNAVDVFLFQRLKTLTKGKYLWLRNNVATILSNCSENFCFCVCGYWLFPKLFTGIEIMPMRTAIMIAATTSIIEIAIAICDTPFLYAAKRLSQGKAVLLNGAESAET